MQAGRWVLGRWAKRAKAIQKGGWREGGRLRRRPFYDGVGRLEDVSDTVRKRRKEEEDGSWNERVSSISGGRLPPSPAMRPRPRGHDPSSSSSSAHLLLRRSSLPPFLPPFSLILTRRQSHVGTWGSKHLASPLRPRPLFGVHDGGGGGSGGGAVCGRSGQKNLLS